MKLATLPITLTLATALSFTRLAAAQDPVPTAPPPPVDWRTALDLPKVDFTGLSQEDREKALAILREAPCTCGCSMKIAECRVRDANCPMSPGLAASVIQGVREGRDRDAVMTQMAAAAPAVPVAPPEAQAPGAVAPARLGPKVKIAVKGAPSKGPKRARVVLVEFSDFQCPYCAGAAKWVESILLAYPKDVKVVFKQFPLDIHKQARLAAQASLAAHEQGKFWEMHDLLFKNFRAINRDAIIGWAREIGLDEPRFLKAIDSARHAADVDREIAEGKAASVQSTPTFFLNDRLYDGPRTLEAIRPLIDGEIAGR